MPTPPHTAPSMTSLESSKLVMQIHDLEQQKLDAMRERLRLSDDLVRLETLCQENLVKQHALTIKEGALLAQILSLRAQLSPLRASDPDSFARDVIARAVDAGVISEIHAMAFDSSPLDLVAQISGMTV